MNPQFVWNPQWRGLSLNNVVEQIKCGSHLTLTWAVKAQTEHNEWLKEVTTSVGNNIGLPALINMLYIMFVCPKPEVQKAIYCFILLWE